MENSKIETFVAAKMSMLTPTHLAVVKEKMASMPDDKLPVMLSVEMKNPTIVWVVSFFFGYLGIDRFIIGSIGAGVGKLLTFGGLGIWWLVDLFIIGKKTRENNYTKLMPFLG